MRSGPVEAAAAIAASPEPRPSTIGQKIYFLAVGALALWVGIWGFFVPASVDRAIPWLVPPLHSQFLGAVYLSGAALSVGGMVAKHYSEVRAAIRIIGIWTGMLLVVSLFYLGDFQYHTRQVQVWFGAYILYPLIALWFLWRNRGLQEDAGVAVLPTWVRYLFIVTGCVFTVLSLLLLIVPNLMAQHWPWKISRMLTQIYSAPFLAYGVNALLLGSRSSWREARLFVIAILVFTFGALVASFLHRDLFDRSTLSAWLWFGVLMAVVSSFSAATVIAARPWRKS